jgi:HK97 family phage major capsid protein
MSNIAELKEKRAHILWQQEDIYRSAKAEARNLNSEEETRFDALEADFASLDKQIRQLEVLEARKAELALAQSRAENASRNTVVETEDTDENYRSVFQKFMRTGSKGLNASESQLFQKRAQTVTTDGGGYLIPTGFANTIEVVMKYFGPMYDSAVTGELLTATGNTLNYPTLNDTANSGRLLGINTQVSTVDMVFGNVQFDAFKYSSDQILVPFELMQDSAIDIDTIVANGLGERLGRIINTHLTTGDASSKPKGVVTASTLGKTAASATAITAAELLDLIHSVDRAYRVGPKVGFMLNDLTLAAIKKLTLGASDATPLWVPSVRDGEPDTIWGHQYWVNNDIDTIATGKKTILFGDFSKYLVRKVAGMRMLRMEERYGDFDQIGFVAFMRVDGDLIAAGSIKHLIQA